MNQDNIVELENFIFSTVEKLGAAANIVTDVIGVLIGLKPSMIGAFSEDTLKTLHIDEFEEILGKLGLERVFFDRHQLVDNEKIKIKHFCISKKIKIAEQTRDTFSELWSTMNDDGEILDRGKWINATKRIGELLGYPKTAVDDYVVSHDGEDEERKKRMERNRYYAHSAKYEDEEFKLYDQKLNSAISDLAPKTADFLSSNKKKRWLV